jgi:DNA-binding HxlR family transcriptional regulator
MPQHTRPQQPTHDAEQSKPNPAPRKLFGLFDDTYTLDILESIRTEAKCARAIAEECDASRPTTYRRLNSLEDIGLVETHTSYDPSGHHRTVYKATLDSITVEMTDDGLSTAISTSTDPQQPHAEIQLASSD